MKEEMLVISTLFFSQNVLKKFLFQGRQKVWIMYMSLCLSVYKILVILCRQTFLQFC